MAEVSILHVSLDHLSFILLMCIALTKALPLMYTCTGAQMIDHLGSWSYTKLFQWRESPFGQNQVENLRKFTWIRGPNFPNLGLKTWLAGEKGHLAFTANFGSGSTVGQNQGTRLGKERWHPEENSFGPSWSIGPGPPNGLIIGNLGKHLTAFFDHLAPVWVNSSMGVSIPTRREPGQKRKQPATLKVPSAKDSGPKFFDSE